MIKIMSKNKLNKVLIVLMVICAVNLVSVSNISLIKPCNEESGGILLR